MSAELFVANIAWEVTEAELRELFESHGRVTLCRLALDRDTGKHRGFAFVTYVTDYEADHAIASLDGVPLHGRSIAVQHSRTRTRAG